jgi:uncharacterized protein
VSVQTFERSIRLSRPPRDVFAWHERPGVLERLTPPWENVVVESHDGIANGARAVLRAKAGPFWTRWEVEHRDYDEGRQFRDVQLKGPFARWEHLHRVKGEGAGEAYLFDEIRYAPPLGPLGEAVAGRWIRRKLDRLFAYRHAVTRDDLEWAARYGSVRPMKVAIAGASGLVGRALAVWLRTQGHDVVRLVRRPPAGEKEIFWEPAKGQLDPHALRGVDVLVNLAGENVAAGRWTRARREAIWASRVQATQTLTDTLAKMRHRPFVFINASATGIYGNRGGEQLDERSERGAGFLADVCDAWEHEAEGAAASGVRTVLMRFGVILTPAGGALAKVLPVFRAGLGGRLGHGRQWMSWIGIDDAVGAIYHAILNQRCAGPMNVTAPVPVTNAEYTATLARVLRKPALLPAPRWALRAAVGAMADEALFGSMRAYPQNLLESGFVFRHEKLEPALRFLLGR